MFQLIFRAIQQRSRRVLAREREELPAMHHQHETQIVGLTKIYCGSPSSHPLPPFAHTESLPLASLRPGDEASSRRLRQQVPRWVEENTQEPVLLCRAWLLSRALARRQTPPSSQASSILSSLHLSDRSIVSASLPPFPSSHSLSGRQMSE